MQLQYCLIKWRNPNVVDTIIFSTSIYSISVMFVDVITSDTPIIIEIMLLLSPHMDQCLVLIWKLLALEHDVMFGFRHFMN